MFLYWSLVTKALRISALSRMICLIFCWKYFSVTQDLHDQTLIRFIVSDLLAHLRYSRSTTTFNRGCRPLTVILKLGLSQSIFDYLPWIKIRCVSCLQPPPEAFTLFCCFIALAPSSKSIGSAQGHFLEVSLNSHRIALRFEKFWDRLGIDQLILDFRIKSLKQFVRFPSHTTPSVWC